MARFDLLVEQSFVSTQSIRVLHNLNRRILSTRLVLDGDPRLSRRERISDIVLEPSNPLNDLTVLLTTQSTGVVQLIAEDTVQSPYYTVEEKLTSQQQTTLSGTAPTKFEYGGNANVGRVLEYVTGEASNDLGFIVIGDGFLRGVTYGAFAAGSATFEIRALRGGSDVLLYTFSVTNSREEIYTDLEVSLEKVDQIYVILTAGSINKPYVAIYTQTI